MASGQYFEREPSTGSRRRTVGVSLPDLDVDLVSDAGVFSADRLDPGTKLLLLETPPPDPDWRVVADVGCGYGPIAVTLARRCPDARVWAVDVNRRARELCRENADRLGLGNLEVAAPEEVPDDLRVDAFYSNPPIRIGKARLHGLLAHWLARLVPGGRAHLVVSRNLGADSLHRWLEGQGWPTDRRVSRQGYRLLDVTSPVTSPDPRPATG